MSHRFALDPAELLEAMAALRSVTTVVSGPVCTLAVGPDAGASSDEIRNAFAGLTAEVDALVRLLSEAEARLKDTVDTYCAAEGCVVVTFGEAAAR